jgi:hypothetical protein
MKKFLSGLGKDTTTAKWIGTTYYEGRITSINGTSYHIVFNDGDEIDNTIQNIRLK